MQKLVIKTRNWLRGKGDTSSFLRDSKGKMCCLGFMALQCGLDKNDILGCSDPASLFYKKQKTDMKDIDKSFTGLVDSNGENTDLCYRMMAVNDDYGISDDERKDKLKSLFMRKRIEVVFE